MSIRIWHQSFTVLSDLGAYDEALRAHFRKVARPGTQIHMHGMLPGTYRNNYPGDDIKYSALQYLHGLQFMAAGINAQDQGFDAYAISTLPEPALKETRSLLDIPVVGYGESAMLTACMLGRTFGVLVFINDMRSAIVDWLEVSEFISAFRPFFKHLKGCLCETQRARCCGLVQSTAVFCPSRRAAAGQVQTLKPGSERSGFQVVKCSSRRTMGRSTEWRLIWEMLRTNESLSLVQASWVLRWRIIWLIKAQISPWLRLKISRRE